MGKLSGWTCAKCGGALYEDDKFCSYCDEKVPRCASCGAILPDSAEFCIKCGFSTARKCSCGATVPNGALFCAKCGSRVFRFSLSHASAPASSFEDCSGYYVKFGKYPQEHGNTLEPIDWLVLENDGKTALLLAEYGLDRHPFHQECTDISWRDCDLRKWLNGEFLNRAFSAEERKRVVESVIYTGDNMEYGTKGCGETRDQVFCLSCEEALKYFGNVIENEGCKEQWHSDATDDDFWVNRERACKPTAYAVSHGVLQSKHIWEDSVKGKASEWWLDNCVFWLRSPGSDASCVAFVDDCGTVHSDGDYVHSDSNAVRPALRIML